ncbi:MAG: hypothetical protein ABIS23_07230 [Sphingomicrobium sp.]
MRKWVGAALGAAMLSVAAPVMAQDVPLKGGDFWNVSEITIDDGHFADYADHLAGNYRKTMEFNKSKGWIKDYMILSNVNARADEPDLYLIVVSDRLTTPAEDDAREKELNAYLATTSRASGAQSAALAKYRTLGGNMLLQELLYR